MAETMTVAEMEVIPAGYKKCTKCGQVLPETEEYFYYKDRKIEKFSGVCKVCVKQYRETNQEKIKAQKKIYRETHKDKIKARDKAYRDAYKEKLKTKAKVYREIHRDDEKARHKAYNEAHKAEAKAYRDAHKEDLKAKNKAYRGRHKEEYKIYKQTRRAKKKQLASTFTKSKWQATKAAFESKCAYCGSSDKLTQDHFIPLSKNGAYTAANIIPACPHCNSSKSAQDFEVWYRSQDFYSPEREQHILDYISRQKELEAA